MFHKVRQRALRMLSNAKKHLLKCFQQKLMTKLFSWKFLCTRYKFSFIDSFGVKTTCTLSGKVTVFFFLVMTLFLN